MKFAPQVGRHVTGASGTYRGHTGDAPGTHSFGIAVIHLDQAVELRSVRTVLDLDVMLIDEDRQRCAA